jgi:hypothetical protein
MKSGGKRRSKRQKAYNRALRVLANMRRTGAPLNAAARQERMDPRTVRKYLGAELKSKRGQRKTEPTRNDRRRRRMLIPTVLGTAPTTVVGSKDASLLGRYMSEVGQYLRTGETNGLREFEGKSIGGTPLITDPETLTLLAQAGSLELDRIYALPGASS